MGRRTNKEKSLKRKEEKIRLAVAYKVVKKANELENPLNDFPAFQKFEKNGFIAKLECYNVGNLDKETLDWILQLEKDNMKEIYDSCSWGWNDEEKTEEMTDKAAKYLIARTEDNKPVAFAHFRFDMDDGDEVLYCYELQLDPNVRRQGLGKFMLQVLELMAFKNGMRKVVLTVLKHNTDSNNFFFSMRYTTDCTNPEENLYENIPYQILSKLNKNLRPHGCLDCKH